MIIHIIKINSDEVVATFDDRFFYYDENRNFIRVFSKGDGDMFFDRDEFKIKVIRND